MNLPNAITILRLFAVPAVVWAIADDRIALAFWIFLAAGISDAVDGFIARHFNMQSELGAYLDPVADKALLVSIYVALALTGQVPGWLTLAVVVRDVVIVSAVAASWAMEQPVTIRPLIVSKLNTAAQIGFAALMLGATGFSIPLGNAYEVGLVLVAGLTAISALAYLFEWSRHLAR
ncbi:CDP-alcohol phosphatidyltransferase family protein [Ancylobacter defluvii]|uniref:CDP-diacylglycerol--glycerol-3-phosphate 3-phosphatidyltransferase n=1 Tax=Ancylobacter defluvii TaxID=1282440 RepID=A0A9W6ND12_9HYPH|nr:CDP-alcohol phosphatidyltransferase family protein [Ancylobacter defluvii]MBS7588004.1 CDP-alcohol phosphatidyltransferase family protein [Ancylobacter defluvii]GLK86398.1 CDP-diacylglycerol--glycerol-3-phosphate 3-phosphatidyltransferase [Ancylobacter defluvii]